MPYDFDMLLYSPTYELLGVPAMLTYTAGVAEITVIDDTRTKTNTSGHLEVISVGPGAFARIPELTAKGVDRSEWANSILAFNGQTWRIRFGEPRGSPNGESQGEVRFALKTTDDVIPPSATLPHNLTVPHIQDV